MNVVPPQNLQAGQAIAPVQGIPQNRQQRRANLQGNNQARQGPAQVLQNPKPTLDHQGGFIRSLRSNKHFSKQAIARIEELHPHLVATRNGDRPSLDVYEGRIQDHKHPLGAYGRQYMHQVITYLEGAHGRILEIGASKTRQHSMYETTIAGQSQSVLERTHMMCPIIDQRDEIRKAQNRLRLMNKVAEHNLVNPNNLHTVDYNSCEHKAGPDFWFGIDTATRQGCPCSNPNFDIISSVDSIYYEGVLMEIFEQLIRHPGLGYIAFNNYHRAMVNKMNKQSYYHHKGRFTINGVAEPNVQGSPESEFIIDASDSQNAGPIKISVSVQGNPMAYCHNVLRTGVNDNQFYYEHLGSDGNEYLFLFELIKELHNGDTPYQLFRVTKTNATSWSPSDRSQADIITFANRWVSYNDVKNVYDAQLADAETTRSNNLKNEQIASKLLKQGKSKEQAAEIIKKKQEKALKRQNYVAITGTDFFGEEEWKNKIRKVGDKDIDLMKLNATIQESWNFIDKIKAFFETRDASFRVRIGESGEPEVKLTARTQSWWIFKRDDKSLTCKAKLSDVMAAYHEIGIKSMTKSLMQAGVTMQRDAAKKDGLSTATFLVPEAVTIARYIRAVQEARHNKIMASVEPK